MLEEDTFNQKAYIPYSITKILTFTFLLQLQRGYIIQEYIFCLNKGYIFTSGEGVYWQNFRPIRAMHNTPKLSKIQEEWRLLKIWY